MDVCIFVPRLAPVVFLLQLLAERGSTCHYLFFFFLLFPLSLFFALWKGM